MKRGSDWIRCDLHVHSPASFFHCYGDRNDPRIWERYISELEALPNEFKILGINDYLTLDGYLRVRMEHDKGRLQNIDVILPVLEFRINRLVGGIATKRLNYHAIFSDSVAPQIIQSQFLDAIRSTYKLEAGQKHASWSGIISEASLQELGRLVKQQSPDNVSLQAESDWKVGFNNFNVDYAELRDILSIPPFRNLVLTAVGKAEWDQFRWDGGGAAEKRTIINEADFVFIAADSVVQCERSYDNLRANKVNDRLMDCSDSHYFGDSAEKDRIGNCLTWIKAEPSFNGLRQVLFVPQERIAFSEAQPQSKSPYQVIKKIRFQNGADLFGTQELPLSPYLTSIVGGKSTGKSLLAGLIVKSADIAEYKRRTLAPDTEDPLLWLNAVAPELDFEVIWEDGEITSLRDSNSRKVTYFPQHYLNSRIERRGEHKELNRLVRSILMQMAKFSSAFEAFTKGLQDLDEKIAATAVAFESSRQRLDEARERSAEKGKSQDLRANIERLQKDFEILQRQYNLTEEEISQHAKGVQELAELRAAVTKLASDVAILRGVNLESLSQRISLDGILSTIGLNQLSEEQLSTIRAAVGPLLETFRESLIAAVSPIVVATEDRVTQKDALETSINVRLAPLLEKFSGTETLRLAAQRLSDETTKLNEVLELESHVSSLEAQMWDHGGALVDSVAERESMAARVVSTVQGVAVSTADPELGINIVPRVKSAHIQGVLRDRVKYQSNAPIRAIVQNAALVDSDTTIYEAAVAEIVSQASNGQIEFKGDHTLASVLQELLCNAIYLQYDLTLTGESFATMSPGKKALTLLRVIIELDQSQHPIVMDQPEDDLDNRSIYEGLAAYIIRKKIERQIIVVTHNPNVVVGGDSEYVIVANQSGQEANKDNETFRFEYVFGGLENSFVNSGTKWTLHKQGIREHVCEVLDGGREAFARRERLYSSMVGT